MIEHGLQDLGWNRDDVSPGAECLRDVPRKADAAGDDLRSIAPGIEEMPGTSNFQAGILPGISGAIEEMTDVRGAGSRRKDQLCRRHHHGGVRLDTDLGQRRDHL